MNCILHLGRNHSPPILVELDIAWVGLSLTWLRLSQGMPQGADEDWLMCGASSGKGLVAYAWTGLSLPLLMLPTLDCD